MLTFLIRIKEHVEKHYTILVLATQNTEEENDHIVIDLET